MKHTLSKALITFAVIIATMFGTSQLASAHNNPYKPDCYPSTTTSTVPTTSTSTVPPTTSTTIQPTTTTSTVPSTTTSTVPTTTSTLPEYELIPPETIERELPPTTTSTTPIRVVSHHTGGGAKLSFTG